MSTIDQDKQIQIVLLDYHDLFRQGLQALLADQPYIEVVGEAGDSETALAVVAQVKPAIALLELNLDSELNTEIISDLLVAAPTTRIILLTGIDDPDVLQLSVQMGVMGILQKSIHKRVLVKAIEKVHAGEVWIDRVMMANVLDRLARRKTEEPPSEEQALIETISERELEVIALVGEGLKNKQIADRLSISETTVRHHLTSVYSKLDVSDRLELAIFAYRNRLAKMPE